VPAAAADTDPFTIVLIPDTQNYTYSNRTAYLDGQLDWVVASRESLNTKFVAHLGDLVSNYDSSTQWPIISNAMKKLDDAGVPNSVIPGNHDFNTTTREFDQYDTHFPVSRYAQASWNSPTLSTAATSARTSSAPTASTGRT
jgi:predicted MPP superfamily phosphohydrolase